MSICYLNNDYEKKYRCEYRTETDIIKVDVEYDIGEEIELKNGVRVWDAILARLQPVLMMPQICLLPALPNFAC